MNEQRSYSVKRNNIYINKINKFLKFQPRKNDKIQLDFQILNKTSVLSRPLLRAKAIFLWKSKVIVKECNCSAKWSKAQLLLLEKVLESPLNLVF